MRIELCFRNYELVFGDSQSAGGFEKEVGIIFGLSVKSNRSKKDVFEAGRGGKSLNFALRCWIFSIGKGQKKVRTETSGRLGNGVKSGVSGFRNKKSVIVVPRGNLGIGFNLKSKLGFLAGIEAKILVEFKIGVPERKFDIRILNGFVVGNGAVKTKRSKRKDRGGKNNNFFGVISNKVDLSESDSGLDNQFGLSGGKGEIKHG